MNKVFTITALVTGFMIMGAVSGSSAALADDSPAATVASFSDALERKDAEAIELILAADVVIFESGGVERSLEEYKSHHMEADMAFLAATEDRLINEVVVISGEMAVVTQETETEGVWNNREISSLGKGTYVLARRDSGWVITHIHWSSRQNR